MASALKQRQELGNSLGGMQGAQARARGLEEAVFPGRVAGNRFFEGAKQAQNNSEAFTYCLFGGAYPWRSVDLARARSVPAVGQS